MVSITHEIRRLFISTCLCHGIVDFPTSCSQFAVQSHHTVKRQKHTRTKKRIGRRPYNIECFPKPSKDGSSYDLRVIECPFDL